MAADGLLAMLELDRVDRDLYRAPVRTDDEREHLFGGQVAAQAIRAAAHTVPDGRTCHSMHGYFLRRGDPGRDVILRVHRDRDGGSFSARRVVAIQEGEVIFTVSSSFHHREPGGVYQVEPPEDFPGPDGLDPGNGGGPPDFFESRPLLGPHAGAERRLPPSRVWVRSRGSLPDDPVVHLCALVYVTDFGSGFAEANIPGVPPGGPSLDHSIWFHDPIRLDEWALIDLWPLRASGARGTYLGTVHDRQGSLGCVLAQEALLREGGRVDRASDQPG
ncbi:MAG TPA: acyl-CoA thioesterase domain-containing protein [Acidimicrobiales bacterium]|nr:acyl-CoA thioesterase domain-containing protein [Acidimicrobiales bacterium]